MWKNPDSGTLLPQISTNQDITNSTGLDTTCNSRTWYLVWKPAAMIMQIIKSAIIDLKVDTCLKGAMHL